MLEAKFGENPFKTDFNKYNQLENPKIIHSQTPKNVLINLPIVSS